MKNNIIVVIISIFIFSCLGNDELSTDEILAKNEKEIATYLKENNLEAKQTRSGLRYIIAQEGAGELPKFRDSVFVNYVGYLTDGTVFDTNIAEIAKEKGIFKTGRTYKPFGFILGSRQVIAGWDEGIALLNKNAKAKLIIPSYLGYGTQQSGELISPNSVLIFDVELVNFK